MRFKYLVLLVVMATITATAQTTDSPGRFKARQVSTEAEVFIPPTVPTFYAVGVGDYVATAQSVTIRVFDLSVGEDNEFYICRHISGDVACYDPIVSGDTFIDVIPAQSAGKLAVYRVVKTSKKLGGVLDFGDLRPFADYSPSAIHVVGSKSVSAELRTVQPCDNLPPSQNCLMYWVDKPNYISVHGSGTYPAGSRIYVLATAKDGSVGRQPVLVSTDEDTASVSFLIPRVTYRVTPISLTEFNSETRVFRTLVDAIPPLSPAGTQSEVR